MVQMFIKNIWVISVSFAVLHLKLIRFRSLSFSNSPPFLVLIDKMCVRACMSVWVYLYVYVSVRGQESRRKITWCNKMLHANPMENVTKVVFSSTLSAYTLNKLWKRTNEIKKRTQSICIINIIAGSGVFILEANREQNNFYDTSQNKTKPAEKTHFSHILFFHERWRKTNKQFFIILKGNSLGNGSMSIKIYIL